MHSHALAAVALALGSVVPRPTQRDGFLFGKKSAEVSAPVDSQRRTWRISEFTAIQIVPARGGFGGEPASDQPPS